MSGPGQWGDRPGQDGMKVRCPGYGGVESESGQRSRTADSSDDDQDGAGRGDLGFGLAALITGWVLLLWRDA